MIVPTLMMTNLIDYQVFKLIIMKKLNSLKESLFIKEVSQKEMSKIKGGRAFSSVTMEKTVKLTTTFQSKLTIDFGAN